MTIHPIDLIIIGAYLVLVVVIGFVFSRRAGQNLDSYFLGGKTLPWSILGIANASSMFDITGTMWLVYILFVYGLKGVWLPWLWPTFNQIFLMIYLAVWIRRSNVLTGAEWITTRFGSGKGGELSRISVVVFALVSVVGFLSYAFQGIGKFAAVFFPWDLGTKADPFSSAPIGIKPEWYFLFMFQLFKFLPGEIFFLQGEFVGIILFAVGGILWTVVPFWDRKTPAGKRNSILTYFGIFVIVFIIVFTILGFILE